MELTKRGRGRPSNQTQLNQEELLQCALKSFAKYGFDGVKMSGIAKQLNVANSLLSYRFKDKEDLWRQAIQFAYEKLRGKFADVFRNFKDLDGVTRLKVLIRQSVYFAAEFPEYFIIFNQEMHAKSKRGEWLMNEMWSPIFEHAQQLFQKEIEKGNLKNLPINNLAMISTGAANLFFQYQFFFQNKSGVDVFDEKQIEQHADAVIEVFFNGVIAC